jgi:hypothetical protein
MNTKNMTDWFSMGRLPLINARVNAAREMANMAFSA